MPGSDLSARVAAVRHFSRFYTRKIGVLQETLLDSPFTLAQARLVYELAARDTATAGALAADLGMDAGHVSRLLADLQRRRYIRRRTAADDRRSAAITLTARGRAGFEGIDRRSRGQISALLGPLPLTAQRRIVSAMADIEAALDPGGRAPAPAPILLRPHRPGDIGWIVSRHGAVYAVEFGWSIEFEALVARIAGDVLRKFDPRREHIWIAERAGERVGSCVVVAQGETVAKLRLVLVDFPARGEGLGRRMVLEAMAFARAAGYRRMTLWTHDVLIAARRLYAGLGFRLKRSERGRHFGVEMASEIWECSL